MLAMPLLTTESRSELGSEKEKTGYSAAPVDDADGVLGPDEAASDDAWLGPRSDVTELWWQACAHMGRDFAWHTLGWAQDPSALPTCHGGVGLVNDGFLLCPGVDAGLRPLLRAALTNDRLSIDASCTGALAR